ncbi:MAG: glycosyltransferase [Melioribacter sp.]|nr:glycosyltransferase [Melioribacter sp.]
MRKKPFVSVIVCTYNREKYLPLALNSLINQTVDKDIYEVIIVNNNSTDNTEAIAQEFIETNKELNVKYVIEFQKGLSAARNRGIKESDGEIIIFIDDDAEVTPNYIEEAIKFFEEYPKVDAMGGKIIPKYEDNQEPKWMSIFLWGLVTKSDWGDKIRKYPYSKYPPGCSMSFRKKVFDEIGLFNTDLTLRCDDKYIFKQMDYFKKKYLYNPNFVVYHNINKERLTNESIKKISMLVGIGERLRLTYSPFYIKALKVIEYIFKLVSAFVISLYYILTLKFSKAFYLIKNRWYTLLGYFKKEL